jgi:hypothetical protein
MSLRKKLTTLLKGWMPKRKPKFLIDNPGKIVEAFVHEGITYYTFSSVFDLPTIRGLQALNFYDELEMRCTHDFLKAHVNAALEILNPAQGQRLDLTRLSRLVSNLKERLEMLPTGEHIFRLASVVFFDETESPFFYSPEYAKKKIERWKQDPEILAFFLQQPLKALLPLSNTDKISSHIYSAVTEKVNALHLKEIFTTLSVKGTTIEM